MSQSQFLTQTYETVTPEPKLLYNGFEFVIHKMELRNAKTVNNTLHFHRQMTSVHQQEMENILAEWPNKVKLQYLLTAWESLENIAISSSDNRC